MAGEDREHTVPSLIRKACTQADNPDYANPLLTASGGGGADSRTTEIIGGSELFSVVDVSLIGGPPGSKIWAFRCRVQNKANSVDDAQQGLFHAWMDIVYDLLGGTPYYFLFPEWITASSGAGTFDAIAFGAWTALQGLPAPSFTLYQSWDNIVWNPSYTTAYSDANGQLYLCAFFPYSAPPYPAFLKSLRLLVSRIEKYWNSSIFTHDF